jgi:hypothetical protein
VLQTCATLGGPPGFEDVLPGEALENAERVIRHKAPAVEPCGRYPHHLKHVFSVGIVEAAAH